MEILKFWICMTGSFIDKGDVGVDQPKPWIWAWVVAKLVSPPALPHPDHQALDLDYSFALSCHPMQQSARSGANSPTPMSSRHLCPTPSLLDTRASSIVLPPGEGAGGRVHSPKWEAGGQSQLSCSHDFQGQLSYCLRWGRGRASPPSHATS
jgi:hypothetical protein